MPVYWEQQSKIIFISYYSAFGHIKISYVLFLKLNHNIIYFLNQKIIKKTSQF